MPNSTPKISWTSAAALLAGIGLCYWKTIAATASLLVHSDDMAHGFFAPIIAAFILWLNRDRIRARVSTPSEWGLVLLMAAALLAIPASLGASTTVARLGFIMSLAGGTMVLGGARLLAAIGFPLSLLLFTFPIPAVLYGEVTLPLQLLASRLAEFTFEMLGYSVLREGNIIELAHQKLSVVEACSGLRSLITLSFFTAVYAYLLEERNWLRVLLLAVAVPSAILINAMRITLTGVLGSYDPALTKGTAHDITGWFCFLVGFLIVLAVHQVAKWRLPSPLKPVLP